MQQLFRVSVIAALCGVALIGQAQDGAPSAEAIRRAAEKFSLGKEAYRAEDFVAAGEHFEAADEKAPSVNALRAAMTSRKKAGQLDRAASLAALALMRHPEDAKLSEEAEAILAEAQGSLQRVSVTCDEPCSLVVGTSLVHGGPRTDQIVFLTPGQHVVRASWEASGSVASETVVAIAEGDDEIEFLRPEDEGGDEGASIPRDGVDEFGMEIGDEVEPEPEPRAERHGPRPLFFAIGAVTTAALTGVTVWSGIDTKNNPGADAVVRFCSNHPDYPDPTDCPLYQEGQRKELRTNVLIGATAAVGVTTVVLGAMTDWSGKRASSPREGERSARERRRLSAWLAVGDGAMVGARGRF